MGKWCPEGPVILKIDILPLDMPEQLGGVSLGYFERSVEIVRREIAEVCQGAVTAETARMYARMYATAKLQYAAAKLDVYESTPSPETDMEEACRWDEALDQAIYQGNWEPLKQEIGQDARELIYTSYRNPELEEERQALTNVSRLLL